MKTSTNDQLCSIVVMAGVSFSVAYATDIGVFNHVPVRYLKPCSHGMLYNLELFSCVDAN